MDNVDPQRLLPRTLIADQGKAKDKSHEGRFDREVQHYWTHGTVHSCGSPWPLTYTWASGDAYLHPKAIEQWVGTKVVFREACTLGDLS